MEDNNAYFVPAKLLSEHGNPLSEDEVGMVAKATSGYSGSDLTNLARDAAFGPIRDVPSETLMTLDKTHLRKIQLEDFRKALAKVRPSVSKDGLKRYSDWNAKFGDIS